MCVCVYNIYIIIHITCTHTHMTLAHFIYTHTYTLEGKRARSFHSTSLHFGVMVSLGLNYRDITLWIWDEPENWTVFCVYVCVYVMYAYIIYYICVCDVCIYYSMCLCVFPECTHVYPSPPSVLSPWSHWLARCPASSQDSLFLPTPSAGVTDACCHTSLSIGSGDAHEGS